MNNVNYLLRVHFSTLPLEEKLEIKRLGPHRPDDLILLQPGQKATRTFKTEWYDRKTWLTASTSKQALFCFPCLLFGNGTNADSVWTTDGFKDLWSIWQLCGKCELGIFETVRGRHQAENTLRFGESNFFFWSWWMYQCNLQGHRLFTKFCSFSSMFCCCYLFKLCLSLHIVCHTCATSLIN